MDSKARIEAMMERSLARIDVDSSPPKLAEAIRYAVFPGGARVRPRLCLAVSAACGNDRSEVAEAAAAAIELLHCASLVHDDLPCFDDADQRRGKPSAHRAYGEPLAILTGDALIVAAFQQLAVGAAAAPRRLQKLLTTISQSVGLPHGIAAGQAWECEAAVNLAQYQQEKTGSLFAAATVGGAQAAGVDAKPWAMLGNRLGEAYQIADDIRDCAGNAEELGKPIGQDEALDRPSAVREFGIDQAIANLKRLVCEGIDSIPDCPGANTLRDLIAIETKRFLPKGISRQAA